VAQPTENMNCPNCQTPMEDGLIDKSYWFKRRESERTRKFGCALMSFFGCFTVRRVTAHRCPACSHVALTAP
jgi:Domain of unknown function (DUF6487)